MSCKASSLSLQLRIENTISTRYRLTSIFLNHKNYPLGSRLARLGLRRRLTGVRQPNFVRRSYWDTDEYDLDVGYESDDYSWPDQDYQAVHPRVVNSSEQSRARAATTTEDLPSSQLNPTYNGINDASVQSTYGDISAPGSLPLVDTICRASLEVIQRIHGALVATGSAVLLLLGQVGHQGSRHARAVRVRACRSLRRTKAGARMQAARQRARTFAEELPEGFWGKLMWLWERPPVQKLRLTWSLANLSIKLPAVLALVATQVGLLASQVSLPMLAPLLLGTGMLFRSIKSNASFLFPRIGLFVVLAWLLWFANSVIQSTAAYLRKQGAIDNRLASAMITASECSALLGALLILLSMLGVNIGSALLLPAGIAVAIAAKDLSHNWLAGFFLFVAQPFRMGDRVAVSFSSPGAPGAFTSNWFEGVCEKIDLRYTSIRQGSRRLMVPNSAFITREFMILDDVPASGGRAGSGPSSASLGGSTPSGEGFLPTPFSPAAPSPALNGSHMGQYPPPPDMEFVGDDSEQADGELQPAWNPMQHMMAAGPYHAEVAAAAAAAGPRQEQEPGGLFPDSPSSTPASYHHTRQQAQQQQQQQPPLRVNGSRRRESQQAGGNGSGGAPRAHLVGVNGFQDGYPTSQQAKVAPGAYPYPSSPSLQSQQLQQQRRAQGHGSALQGYSAAGSAQLPGGVPGHYYDPSLHAELWSPQQRQPSQQDLHYPRRRGQQQQSAP